MINNGGKMPPQAIDIEEAVLGQFIEGYKLYPAVWSELKEEIFYKDSSQKICHAILQLKSKEAPIDVLTVAQQLRKNGDLEMVGGSYYITELCEKVTKLEQLSYHIGIVHEKFLQREVIRMCSEHITQNFSDECSPLESIGVLIRQMNDLKNGLFRRNEKSLSDLMDEAETEKNRPKVDGLLGISSGIDALDQKTKGWQKTHLIIDAGRPAMGKTAKLTSQVKHIAIDQNIPVGVFSLEMKAVSLAFRLWSNDSDVENSKIKENRLTQYEDNKIKESKLRLKEAPVFIDDTPGLDIATFETKAALMVALHGVQIIFIDYLQLMNGDPSKKYNGSREAEISDISRRLKKCANELDIPIIALSQLSRAVETRKNCMPILSDLRESGSIEQDADIVVFNWRPEYYEDIIKDLPGVHIEDSGVTITNLNGLLINIVAKCREGETGKAPSLFIPKYMRVTNHPDMMNKVESEKQSDLFQPIQRPVNF